MFVQRACLAGIERAKRVLCQHLSVVIVAH
jgi:hypothetical protein